MMMWLGVFAFLIAVFSHTATADSTFTPARPPAYPLAVKSPYLNTWLRAGNTGSGSGYLPGTWPSFYSNRITGWTGIIRVDGKAYTWMGLPGTETVNQVDATYTSTKTIFTMDVEDKIELKVAFLSPLFPDDFKRQSLVFSYLNLEVRSKDGEYHDVQVYTDVSGEWASGDSGTVIEWEYGTAGNASYHKFHRQTQLAYSEINDQTEFGSWYYAADSSSQVSYEAGADVQVRAAFQKNGFLHNTIDTNYRAINKDWPVFGFAVDLGAVNSSPRSTHFSIGLAQRTAAQFSGAKGYKPVASLWTSFFQYELQALEFFHSDFDYALSINTALDDRISKDSLAAAGQDYLTITSLSARQAMAGTQLVGTPDRTFLFLKEISSNGNFQTVDIIYPMHPILLYLNPTLLKLIMDPHYEYQESGQYPKKSAVHDLGAHYPNATGHNDGNDEPMPLEECGNMLIMTLAYAQRTKDIDYLHQHYDILSQWTSYLVEDSLYPDHQLSTDDFSGPLENQTNLALKGMIGIAAMAQIAELTGHTFDARDYYQTASLYVSEWLDLGIAEQANPAHTILNYGNDNTWGLLYNLYADRELGLNMIPQWVYDMQDNFYPTVQRAYGVPLDTRHNWTKSDWEIFVAAISNSTTRDMFLHHIATWINETNTNRPLTDLYDTDTGSFPSVTFTTRPVMGASFALLVLPDKSTAPILTQQQS